MLYALDNWMVGKLLDRLREREAGYVGKLGWKRKICMY